MLLITQRRAEDNFFHNPLLEYHFPQSFVRVRVCLPWNSPHVNFRPDALGVFSLVEFRVGQHPHQKNKSYTVCLGSSSRMPIKTFGVAIVALVLASMEVFAGEPDAKRYSYVCLESNQDLCLGISPGDADPVYDAANLNYLQVKSRSRNEEQALDYRKMRW